MSKYSNTVIVTGGTSGIGFACALSIARQRPDWHVVIASRTDGNNASQVINRRLGQDNVTYAALDLSSLENIRAFASAPGVSSHPPICALVLNAAWQSPHPTPTYTTDGIERTFGVNHVGHALLFHLLQPYLTPDAHIVVVTSGAHDPQANSGLPAARYDTAEALAHPPLSPKIKGRQRYTTSKLCNVLWAYALHDHIRRAGKSWTVTAVCPGGVPGTNLAREGSWFERFAWTKLAPRCIPLLRLVWTPYIFRPEESGDELAKLLMRPSQTTDEGGRFFQAGKPIPSSADSYDRDKQRDLWTWTAHFVARNDEERKKFEELL